MVTERGGVWSYDPRLTEKGYALTQHSVGGLRKLICRTKMKRIQALGESNFDSAPAIHIFLGCCCTYFFHGPKKQPDT